MEKLYKISKRETLNSFKFLIWFSYFLPFAWLLGIPLGHFRYELTWDESIIIAAPATIFGFILFGLAPTLLMYLFHYRSNKGVKVIIDNELNTIAIKKDINFKYSLNQLEVTLHRPIYHKNKIDKNNRLFTPWSNFSFIKIRTMDNKEFNISSLMIPLNELSIAPIKVKYSLWPMIGNWYVNLQDQIDQEQKNQEERLNFWIDKFEHLSINELYSKLENSSSLDRLPLKAIQELIKRKTANKSYKA